jgi:hypothetical protein
MDRTAPPGSRDPPSVRLPFPRLPQFALLQNVLLRAAPHFDPAAINMHDEHEYLNSAAILMPGSVPRGRFASPASDPTPLNRDMLRIKHSWNACLKQTF